MKKSIYFSALLLFLFGTGYQTVQAQNWGGTTKPRTQPQQALTAEAIAERRKKARQKFKTTELKQGITVPNMPPYPAASTKGGVKFVRALQYTSLGKGDNCIVQSFLVKDPPESVREWYKTTLATYQWTVQPANATATQILGRRRKDGANVHIMVAPVSDKSDKKAGFKSAVQIRYVQWVPLPDNPDG